MASEVRKRSSQTSNTEIMSEKTSTVPDQIRPSEENKHYGFVQMVRLLLFISWFLCCAFCIHITQLLGSPLYVINRDYYYAYMALTKQSFGIVIATVTKWFCPSVIRTSWTPDLNEEFVQTEDGRMETRFPERLVLIANHQIYTDWLYLWWVAYTSKMHGHIYIILKEVYKYVPIIGPGMMYYGFVFMTRKWASDQPRMKHRLEKLKTRHKGPLSGSAGLDPMWMLIYPEGTNLSGNTRKGSVRWSERSGIPDMKHQLLPRSTGLYFCLQQLRGTVEWVYDCTVAYEGVRWVKNAYEVFGANCLQRRWICAGCLRFANDAPQRTTTKISQHALAPL